MDPDTEHAVQDVLARDTFYLGGDLRVPRLGFGAMRITGPGIWGPPEDEAAAKAVLHRAVELGIRLVDTADSYGPKVSERLIGEAFPTYPDDVVVATKGGLLRAGPGQWTAYGSPIHLREALAGSLERLHLERIDLYQFHRPDRKIPLEVSLGALAEARDAGRIRHVGLSNVTVEQLDQAREVVPVVSVQNRFNLAHQDDRDVLDRCRELGIAFLPWFPLEAGVLAGPEGPVAEVAARHAATPVQVALAWLLAQGPHVLPIPGTSKVAHLEENAAAVLLELGDEDLEALERAA